ncbi:MAG: IclR family transcriptional regulator [Verrucomicrobiota bacterium]
MMPELDQPKPASQSPSTDRALDILEAMSHEPSGLTLSELVRATELPQNSVYRIANALLARGYVHRRESDKRFTLSNRFFDLGRPKVNEKSLVVCSYEGLQWLRDQTGETAQLMVRSGRHGVVLEQVAGLHPIQVSGAVGMRIPLYSCAPGKAILAHLPDNEFEGWLDSVTLKSFTPKTLSTSEVLVSDLKQTKQRGYAVDREEGLGGIHCIAAPILNSHAYPVASITVMAPVFRLPEAGFDDFGAKALAAANMIRDRLLN